MTDNIARKPAHSSLEIRSSPVSVSGHLFDKCYEHNKSLLTYFTRQYFDSYSVGFEEFRFILVAVILKIFKKKLYALHSRLKK